MNSSFGNPWADLVLQQLWVYRQATAMAAKSIDTELLGDPQALTDYCLHPTEQRLNPLEFHGQRRAAPRRAAQRRAAAHQHGLIPAGVQLR